MRGANLTGANLKDANLSGAILEGAAVSGANLEGANLEDAVLTGVDTRSAKMSGARMGGTLTEPSETAKAKTPQLLEMAKAKAVSDAEKRGRYDRGWDAVREEWFARQKALGIVPADAKLSPRNPDVQAWDELDADRKHLFARMQEAFPSAKWVFFEPDVR